MSAERRLDLSADGRAWLRDGRPWRPQGGLYLVLGSPIAQSLSPLIQNAALREAGLPECYYALDLEATRLPVLKAQASALALRGFNVTHPHKADVAQICDRLTAEASAAGVVNTVTVASDKSWHGHNTDIEGIACALREMSLDPDALSAPLVRIFGAGGSARAAVLALSRLAISACRVHARPGPSRLAFSDWLEVSAPRETPVEVVDWPAPGTASLSGDLVISTVPAGVETRAFFAQSAPGRFLDLRYGDIAGSGAPSPDWIHRDGLSVLVAQGAAAFDWWFERKASRFAMQQALASRRG